MRLPPKLYRRPLRTAAALTATGMPLRFTGWAVASVASVFLGVRRLRFAITWGGPGDRRVDSFSPEAALPSSLTVDVLVEPALLLEPRQADRRDE